MLMMASMMTTEMTIMNVIIVSTKHDDDDDNMIMITMMMTTTGPMTMIRRRCTNSYYENSFTYLSNYGRHHGFPYFHIFYLPQFVPAERFTFSNCLLNSYNTAYFFSFPELISQEPVILSIFSLHLFVHGRTVVLFRQKKMSSAIYAQSNVNFIVDKKSGA